MRALELYTETKEDMSVGWCICNKLDRPLCPLLCKNSFLTMHVKPLAQLVIRSLLDPYDFVPVFVSFVRCLHELGIDLDPRKVFSHLIGKQRFLRAEASDVRALTDESDVNRPLIEVVQEHALIVINARVEPPVCRAASVHRRHRLVADRPVFSLFWPGPLILP